MKRMKKILTIAAFLSAFALALTSCSNEELSTDQYDGDAVLLQAYGPQPVVRGGQLRFIGSHLEKVVSVTIPESNLITDIEVVASGKHSEIRVTVPKETSAPGYPVLALEDGTTITGKTLLSYSEPISIESFSPAEILPGETLSIKGDYLNLIHEVVLADQVKISGEAFTIHNRYEIKFVVPETAQTGKFSLGTIDETAIAGTEDEETLLKSLNLIQSDEDLVVKTAEGKLASATLKAGETVTINGTNLNLTKGIELEGASVTDFTATATKLTFTLPAEAADGDVLLVMASGVEVSAGALTTVVPTIQTVSPMPVKSGAQLTITGTDLDLVSGVEIPNAGWVDFAYSEAITLTVPDKAREGDIIFHMANGKSVTKEYSVVAPAVLSFSANPAAAGSDLTVTGFDLDLVVSVTFAGDITVDVEPTETEFTVAVPTAAETGMLLLNLKNGLTINGLELEIDKPAGAYIAAMPETLFSPGDMFIVDIENADHLTGVQFDGVDVNYILKAPTLYTQIPSNATASTTITLVSDNGSVTYAMNIDPGDFIVTPIWTGSASIGNWGGNQDLAWGGYDWSSVAPGMILRLQFTPDVNPGEWFCISLRHGDSWGALAGVPGQYDNPESPFDIVLTQEILDDLVAGYGLVITGYMFTLTEVDLVQDLRYGDTIWEGNASIGNWGGNQDLAWGGYDWSTVKAGQTLFFHFTSDVEPGEWFCISLRHGDSWGALAGVPGQYDNPESPMGVQLTQEIIDDLVGSYGLVVTGYMFTLNKISLK